MATRGFRLTREQAADLEAAYESCADGPTCVRYQAVFLYGIGYPASEVCERTGSSRSSLMEWCRRYRRHGIRGLLDGRRGGNSAKLTGAQIRDLQTRLRDHTPAAVFGATACLGQFWTVEDLRRAVRDWYGVVYRSRNSYYRLFTLCGYDYRRKKWIEEPAKGE